MINMQLKKKKRYKQNTVRVKRRKEKRKKKNQQTHGRATPDFRIHAAGQDTDPQ